jgi:hypothetical protein
VFDAVLQVLAKDMCMVVVTPRDLLEDPAAPGRKPVPAAMSVPPVREATTAVLAHEGLGTGAGDALRPKVTPVSGASAVTGAGHEVEPGFDSWFDEGDLAA